MLGRDGMLRGEKEEQVERRKEGEEEKGSSMENKGLTETDT